MNKRYRSYLYSLAILLLSAALTLAVKYRPRGLSEEECGPLYRQYAHAPGIEASFVKGFRVNDTLAVDATLLRAKDTAAWEQLSKELRLPRPDETSLKGMSAGKDIISLYVSQKGSAAPGMDTEDLDNNDIVGVSFLTQSVAIYHLRSWNQRKAVYHYNYNISTKQQKPNNND